MSSRACTDADGSSAAIAAVDDADGWVLSRQAMAAILKAPAEDLQMDGAEFATHSLRIGGATAMAATRLYSDDEVRRFGRWKSDCWRRYVYTARPERRPQLGGAHVTRARRHGVAAEQQRRGSCMAAALAARALGRSRDRSGESVQL